MTGEWGCRPVSLIKWDFFAFIIHAANISCIPTISRYYDRLHLAMSGGTLGIPRWLPRVTQWYRICLPEQEMQETWLPSLGREDPWEKVMATHSSILAWEIQWAEEAGGLWSMGSPSIRHDWASTHGDIFGCHDLRVGCYWYLVGRDQGCCLIPSNVQESEPTTKNDPDPNILTSVPNWETVLVHLVQVYSCSIEKADRNPV